LATILVEIPERKRPHGKCNCAWVDYIKIYLKEIRREGVDCYSSSSGERPWWAVVNMVIDFRVLQMAENVLISWVTVSFSRITLLHEVT
jgi:hypothetical protein